MRHKVNKGSVYPSLQRPPERVSVHGSATEVEKSPGMTGRVWMAKARARAV